MQIAKEYPVFKLGDQASLDAALLHEDPKIQIQGRSIAAGWQNKLQAWINDEIHRGVEDAAAVPLVITSQAAQILASFIVQSVRQSGHDEVVDHLTSIFAEALPKSVEIFRAARIKGGNA